MSPSQTKSPAQVPGDAESPAKGSKDPTVETAVRHTDKTEPTHSAADKKGTKTPS